MKLFKRIYYPVFGVLLVCALVMGFVDAAVGGAGKTDSELVSAAKAHIETVGAYSRDSFNPTGKTSVSDYILNTLTSGGFSRATATTGDDGISTANIVSRTPEGETEARYAATVTRVTSTVSDDTLAAMDSDKYVGREVTNIIAYVPGTDTLSGSNGQVLLVTARYDAVPGSENASAAAPLSVMLELAKQTASASYKNDIVFLFADGGTEDDIGVYVFANQFAGFNSVTERIALTGDFEPLGTGSTVTLYSGDNAAVLGKYAAVNKSGFMSSAVNLLLGVESAGAAFDAPSVSVGANGVANAAGDTFAALSDSDIKLQAGVMSRFIAAYGSEDLAALNSSDGAVFFSYLNFITVVYPKFVSYILGAIIIVLMAAVIAVNARKKAFGLGRSAAGLFVQAITLVASVLSMFIAYYVIALLAAGFGAFNIHSINSLLFSNVGVLIGAMLLSFALSAAFNTVLKKTFFIKAPDVVRGNVWLWSILGAVLSFAVPQFAYLFAFGAILELIVMLAVTCVKDKYRAKFSSDIERLFLYVVPLIFVMPVAVSFIYAASVSFGLIFLPVIMGLFVLMSGFATPYASYLTPVLDRVAKKLPKRKIRVERVFEEEKIDPAKPGKKGEIVQVRKTVTEKTDWNYHNWIGITAVSVLSCVIILLSSVFGGSVTANAGSRFTGHDVIYDNAVVYLWTKTDSGVEKQVVIKDTDAYAYLSRALTDFSWDASRKAYVKTVYGDDIVTTEPTIAFDSGTYTFTPYDSNRSAVKLTITGASAVTSFKFVPNGDSDEEYEVTNEGEDTVTVYLPYGYGTFTMTTVGTDSQLEVKYVEYRPGEDSNIKNLSEWQDVVLYYSDNDGVMPYINAAIILEYDF